MVTGKAWTPEEVQIICMAYAKMLIMEQNTPPIKFNKSQIRREILPQLDGRSAGSYEMKCCNISAALAKRGFVWIKGYKPLKGYQAILEKAIIDALVSLSPARRNS